MGRSPSQVLSRVVVAWRTHPEVRSVPRVFTERSEVTLVTLNVCNEAVLSWGRGPGIHITPLFFEACKTARLK